MDPFEENEQRDAAEQHIRDQHATSAYDVIEPLKEHVDWRDTQLGDRFVTTLESVFNFFATCWDAFGPVIVIVPLLGGGLFFANYVDNRAEATTWEYRAVANWTEEHPTILLQVEAYLNDGILTEGEYETIEELVQSIEIRQAIMEARSKVQKAMQSQ